MTYFATCNNACQPVFCMKNIPQIRTATSAKPIATVAATDRLLAAWRVMHFALRAVIAEPDRMLAKRGLTRVHHRILFFVARTPGLSVGELQSTLDVTKQALNQPLKDLQLQGLLDIRRGESDGRVRALELTLEGAALEQKLTGEQLRLFEQAFAESGEPAEAGWFDVMAKLSAQLVASADATANSAGEPAANESTAETDPLKKTPAKRRIATGSVARDSA